MLRSIGVDFSIIDPIPVNKDITFDEIGSNSKVIRAKIRVKMAKSKSKNLIKLFFS